MAIIVEWQLPYTAWDWIEITANKVIKVLLREENNLIKLNEDNELYTDLQLVSWITPSDEFPVWVTVWQVLKKDWWLVNGTLLNFQTTSGDYGRWLYWADGHMYYDHWTWTFTQIYSSDEVDALFTQLRWELSTVAFTGDYNDLRNRPTIVNPNDWELTISKNWEPVWTFTANQATDETIDIEVPTTVAELDDASDYAKFSDLAPVATSGDYNDLDNKPTIPVVNDGTLTIQKNGTNVATFTANQSANQTANITVPTTVAELTDSSDYVTDTELSNALSDYTPTANLAAVALSNDYDDLDDKPNLATVATSWSYTDLSNKPTIPSVINNVTSTDTTNALSAAQGKILQDQIDDLSALWKFLSLWDSTTWLPISFPQAIPYTYSTWDYYLVETVWTTNYKPTWSSYTGTASTTVETEEVEVWDLYIYDGTTWLLQLNHGKTVSFANLTGSPSDNAALSTALWQKANSADLATVATTWAYSDLSGTPTLATVATSWSYNDLSNKPTIWSWTLTIQKNGTAIDTFSANATANKTINVTVPTKTSDLTNDSNFVASTSLATVATSGSYADLSNKPTIDTAMSDSSTNAVQNKVIKAYVDSTAWSSADAKVSDTAYASSWNWVTGIAPSKNAVYDKINAMDTTIAGKADSSSLATVATSGSYADLTNKPTIPAAQVNSDWDASSGVAQILNKPTIPTVNDWTLTINQGWTSKWTFTANQSTASTVNLETWKLVTQTEYNNISWASSDWNLYIIYKTV